MMNRLFALLIIASVIFSLLSGSTGLTAKALLEGGKDAVSLTLTLAGGMCLWSGLMNVAKEAGITALLSRALRPLLGRLMPSMKTNNEACRSASMNIVSNLLGLGNAATPLGIETMRSLRAGSTLGDCATREMKLFLVLNTASIQLIPSTLAVIRSDLGCKTPLDILPCVWISSAAALAVGLTVCGVFSRSEVRSDG